MSVSEQVAHLVDMLPDNEQLFALEFVKRLILAWDPDFTKLTPQEAADLEQARLEFERGEFVRHEDIDWDDPSDDEIAAFEEYRASK
jgi:hypothetical protein